MQWPFRRKDREAERREQVRPLEEWTNLPPLAPTSGPITPTAPAEEFVARLATQQRADLAIAPLAHDRSIEARPGIVAGLARPVQRKPDGPEMTHVRKRPDPS